MTIPNSSSPTGYMIYQWGLSSGSPGTTGTQNYPVAFPNAALRVFGQSVNSSASATNLNLTLGTNANFNYYQSLNFGFAFFAIGY